MIDYRVVTVAPEWYQIQRRIGSGEWTSVAWTSSRANAALILDRLQAGEGA